MCNGKVALAFAILLGPALVAMVPAESHLFRYHANAEPVVYASDIAQAVYESFSYREYRDLVEEFCSFGPKPYPSTANGQVQQWIVNQLGELSEGQIASQTVGHYGNVIGRLPGTLVGNRSVIMVGAHYDSVEVSPGANDDGSGVAATLELARVLSRYDWPLDMLFCFWNAEEEGLLGSAEVAEMLAENRTDILVYYNFDMLMVRDSARPSNQSILMAYTSMTGSIYQDSQYWADIARAMNSNYDLPVLQPIRHTLHPYWAYSDHYGFYQERYKTAVFVSESGFNDDVAYHTPDDTHDNPLYDYSLAVSTTASVGAAIAFTLARTLGQPVHERYSLKLAPGQTRELTSTMTLPDEISVRCSWQNGTGLAFSLFDPESSIMSSYSSTMAAAANVQVMRVESQLLGLHDLVVGNEGQETASLTVELVYESDYEGNGVPDSLETWWYDFSVDSDGDSISNGDEEFLGTNRYSADPDKDGLTDFDEVFVYHTIPGYNDSDRDGCPDGWEIDNELNPLRKDDHEDPDLDALSNRDEFLAGTLPHDNDTDGDGCPDGWEVLNNLDPLSDDSGLDPDADLVSNLSEYEMGTDPRYNDLLPPLLVIAALSLPLIALAVVVRRVRLR